MVAKVCPSSPDSEVVHYLFLPVNPGVKWTSKTMIGHPCTRVPPLITLITWLITPNNNHKIMQLINVISATHMLLLNNTFNMTHFKVKIKKCRLKTEHSAFVKSLKDVEK